MISPRQYKKLSKWTRTQIVAHPTLEPVTAADYAAYKRIKVTEEDPVINDKIRTARIDVEQYLSEALVYQIWDAFLELPPGSFPFEGIAASIFARYFGYQPEGLEIPRPPLISVMSIWSYDECGNQTLVDPSVYWVSQYNNPGRIAQRIDSFWPDTGGRSFETFQCRFSCGYLLPFTVTASVPDISVPGHNYSVGSIVQVTNRGGVLPQGINSSTNYFVVSSSPGVSIQISATSGGSAIVPGNVGTQYQFFGVLPDQIRRAILEITSEDRAGNNKNRKGEEESTSMPTRARDYLDSVRWVNL